MRLHPLRTGRLVAATALVASLTLLSGCDFFGDAVDERAPSVEILRPGPGASVAGANVLLTITASPRGELDNFVSFVNVNLNGERLGEATLVDDNTYLFRWNTFGVPDGRHRLEAVAFDRMDARGISNPLEVVVGNESAGDGPAFEIIAPTLDEEVRGTVRVIARPLDGQPPVTRVDFLVDGVVVATLTQPTSGDGYTYEWNTDVEVPGLHALEVRAFSGDGVFRLSAPVSVTVPVPPEEDPDDPDDPDQPGALVFRSESFVGNVKGAVAVGFNNDLYVASEEGTLYAFSPQGSRRWSYEATKGPLRSTPVVGNNEDVFIVSEDGRLHGLTSAGQPMWTPYQVGTGGLIRSTPALGVDGVLYFADTEGWLHAVNGFDGQSLNGWPVRIDDNVDVTVVVPPVISESRRIYVAGVNGFVYAFGADGSRLWKSSANIGAVQVGMALVELAFTTPLPGGGTSTQEVDVMYAATSDGNLYAISGNGVILWQEPLGSVPAGPRRSAPVVDEDGTIYVGTSTGLVALNQDADAFTPRLRFIFPASDVGTPAIDTNGVIYFAGGQTLYAINPNNTPVFTYELGAEADGPMTINRDGLLLVATDTGFVHAINTGSEGLAQGLWPTFQRNARHTGRLGLDADDG